MNLIKKNAKGYNYKYTDLAQVHELLEANGVEYYQYIDVIDSEDYIMTVPIVDGKELPPRRGCRVVQASLKGIDNPAQEQGSALTYARRYSLMMCFGLCTVDDDAMAMSRTKDGKKIEDLSVNATNIEALKSACKEKNIPFEEVLEKAKVNKAEDLTVGVWTKLMSSIAKAKKRDV